jgi:glycosyltransferase involved in cell wall biosynthesis
VDAVRAAGGRDIIFTGYVPDVDLTALVRGAEIFVYPSLFEGVGLPLMEAMAAGVPVITSKVSSMPEIAGGAARLVDPTNEGEITSALAALADDPSLREELRTRGRERAREFSWEAAARRTLEIYTDVLRSS